MSGVTRPRKASIELAIKALGSGQPDVAETICRDHLSLHADSIDHLRLLGQALMQQRRFAAAESQYRTAIALASDFAPLLEDLGSSLAEQGDLAEAIEHFKQAVRLDPQLATANKKLQQALADSGRDKAMPPTLRLNADARIRQEEISENQHCIIVDDCLQNAQELIEFAAQNADQFSAAKSYYPGLFADMGEDAMAEVYRFIRSRMTKHFPFLRHKLKLSSFLSMTTLQPDELSAAQRLCHVDPALDSERRPYAAVLYLFDNAELGGTSFFRYRKAFERLKEVEEIERKNPDKAQAYLLEHFPTFVEPACYMTESNEVAELLCTIPARFNRMIFYSGEIPHSAAITAPELLSKDFRQGRLTLNLFADALPK